MTINRQHPSRRRVLQAMSFSAAAMLTPGIFAEQLAETPAMMEGPFYPDRLPLDTDNDLLIVNDSITPAVGQITHLSGRILGPSGDPIRNAFVEIWQVDGNGVYLHSDTANADRRDANFQGYGRFLTDREGRYYFRTVKPVAYPGRPAPHIHVGVSKNGHRVFTTQLLVKGEPGNEKDGVYRFIRDPEARQRVLADFAPLPDSKLGELAANWDIVLGQTPADSDESARGGIGPPERKSGRAFPRG